MYAEIRVKGCNAVKCQNEAMIQGYQINLILLDSHVDLNDNNNKGPGYTLDGKNNIYLDVTQTKTLELEFMAN